MDDREHAELAAMPAIIQYLISKKDPPHDDTRSPVWREIFDEANQLAQRFGASYARNRRD